MYYMVCRLLEQKEAILLVLTGNEGTYEFKIPDFNLLEKMTEVRINKI